MKDVLLAILKFLCFLLFLPLIIAVCIAFQTQILALPVPKEAWFLWGVGTYIFLNLFVHDFKELYTAGKNAVDKTLGFFKPPVLGYIIPVYAVGLILVYLVVLIFGHAAAIQPYFFFAIAFNLIMHLVLAAHEIYAADKSFLKAHYLCLFGIILIVNLLLTSLLLAWIIPEFSFIAFAKSLAAHTVHLYKTVYKVLFVDSSI